MSDLIIVVAVCVIGYFTFKHEDRIDRLESRKVSTTAQWDSIAHKTALETDSIFSDKIKALENIK